MKKLVDENEFGFRLIGLLLEQQKRVARAGRVSSDFSTVGDVLGSDSYIKKWEKKYAKDK